MATLVDYLVLQSGITEIHTGFTGTNFIGATFDLPEDFVVGLDRAKPVLQYVWHPLKDNGAFGIHVNAPPPPPGSSQPQINDQSRVEMVRWGNEQGRDYGLWVAIRGDKFRAGQKNTIIFAGEESDTHVRFHNIVLWFQRGSN